jgi:hypothetical protein
MQSTLNVIQTSIARLVKTDSGIWIHTYINQNEFRGFIRYERAKLMLAGGYELPMVFADCKTAKKELNFCLRDGHLEALHEKSKTLIQIDLTELFELLEALFYSSEAL